MVTGAEVRQRRRWRLAGVTLLGLVVGAAGMASCGGTDDGGTGTDGPPQPVGKPLDLSAPGVHKLHDPPIDPRAQFATAWTGEVLVVWGGIASPDDSSDGTVTDDGATLDLDDGRWTPMTDSPFPDGLYHPIAAWDGTEVIVIGTECDRTVPPATEGGSPPCPKGPAAAAWSPTDGTWRTLPDPPIPVNAYSEERVIEGTGRAVGGDGAALFSWGWDATTVRWDRATERWRAIESPWPPNTDLILCADSVTEELLVAKQRSYDGPPPAPTDPSELWRMNPQDDAWRAPTSVDLMLGEGFTCGDGAVVTYDVALEESKAWIADLASGTVREAWEQPAPQNFIGATASGAWILSDRIGFEDMEAGTAIRRIDGDADSWVELEGRIPGTEMDVDEGLVLADAWGWTFAFWRPPPELAD